MSLTSTGFWADLAAIFGAISIFITLIFIIIELRKNFEQFRIIREIICTMFKTNIICFGADLIMQN